MDAPPALSTRALTSRGYSVTKAELGDDGCAALRRELTVAAVVFDKHAPPPPKFPVFKEGPLRMYMPKCFGLAKFGVPPMDRLASPEPLPRPLKFAAPLREAQAEPVAAFLAAARDPVRRGGIIAVGCGGGKTVMGLYCVAQLGVKTMIVVHKDFLLTQWQERIAQFLPGASVGLVKAKTVDVEGRDIVLASLQSLSMKEYAKELFAGIGFVVVDEVHRTGTEVFSRAFLQFTPTYSLGLSATVKRKDGLTRVFAWHLGDVVYQRERDREEVLVDMIRYDCQDPAYCEELYIGQDRINSAAMVNNLASHAPRTRWMVDHIVELLRREPDRCVLVLGDRKQMLRDLHALLSEASVDSGFYFGGLKPIVLEESARKSVVLATAAIAREGLDIARLNTLFLSLPMTEIQQAVGRILRVEEAHRTCLPMVVDVVDDFSVFARQAKKRRAYYKRCKYSVRESKPDQATAAAAAAALEVAAMLTTCVIEDED